MPTHHTVCRGFQVVALVAAFSGVRAQNATAIAASASGRGQHNGVAFVDGVLQPLGLTGNSHANAQAASGLFSPSSGQSTSVSNTPVVSGVVPEAVQSQVADSEVFATVPAVSTSLTAVSSSTSNSSGGSSEASSSFTYVAPGQTTGVSIQSNEPAITGNNLLPSLWNVFRGDPTDRPLPPGVGSHLDTRGANHFEASVTPYWVLGKKSRYPVTVSLSADATIADDPYYLGHHYGWISAGVSARVPLSFLPSRFGKWSAGTSADLCYYGTTTDEFAKSVGLQMPKLGAAFSLEL